jgi:hypothetical protein
MKKYREVSPSLHLRTETGPEVGKMEFPYRIVRISAVLASLIS